MSGTPEVYVPGRPPPPAEEGGEAWPPEIYVPPPGPSRRRLSDRVRAWTTGDGDVSRSTPREDRLLELFREPDLRDDVLARLAEEFDEREAEAVAGAGPGGWLLGAPLAHRTGAPFLALSAAGDGEVGGAADGPGGGRARILPGGPLPEGLRVLLVDAFVGPGEAPVRALARRLERAGGRVAGVAALAALGDRGAVTIDDYNTMYISEIS